MKATCPSCDTTFNATPNEKEEILSKKEIDRRYALAQAFLRHKEIESFDPVKKCWNPSTMHSYREMFLFMQYGIEFRIKPTME